MQEVETILEIGINANADINIAKRLIDVAVSAGVDYVKFQKRTPELCVPDDQKDILKDTPWGKMTYLDYKEKMEFGQDEYEQISGYCKNRIKWFASVWDLPSVKFIQQFDDCAFVKVPSAKITDGLLLWETLKTGKGIIISSGMSDIEMIKNAVGYVKSKLCCIMHSTSTYPAKTEELNLNCIPALRDKYGDIIGFSNHHPGIISMVMAAVLGATMIEFHGTLDRSMWGTDQAASIEPEGVHRLIKYLKTVPQSLGDGRKRIYDSELPIMAKLRG